MNDEELNQLSKDIDEYLKANPSKHYGETDLKEILDSVYKEENERFDHLYKIVLDIKDAFCEIMIDENKQSKVTFPEMIKTIFVFASLMLAEMLKDHKKDPMSQISLMGEIMNHNGIFYNMVLDSLDPVTRRYIEPMIPGVIKATIDKINARERQNYGK